MKALNQLARIAAILLASSCVSAHANLIILSSSRELVVNGYNASPPPVAGESFSLSTQVTTTLPSSVSLTHSLEGMSATAAMTSWLNTEELNFQLETVVSRGPVSYWSFIRAMAKFDVAFRVDEPTAVVLTGVMKPGDAVGLGMTFVSFETPSGSGSLDWQPPWQPIQWVPVRTLNESLILEPGVYSFHAFMADSNVSSTPYDPTVTETRQLDFRIGLASVPEHESTAALLTLGLLSVFGLQRLPRNSELPLRTIS